jgi:type I restriction enzyme S subunit
LNSIFSQKVEGWVEKKFEEICVLQRGFDLPTHSRKSGKYALVSSNGITDRIDLWKVKGPGVITGRSGTIGKIHYVDEDFWPLNTALYIKNFQGNYERCIYYFLKQFDLEKYGTGAGVPTLNRNNVHSVMVYFPANYQEQLQIVQRLDTLSVETKKLESKYQAKLDSLEELKKSVLEKAFRGEIV